MVVVMLISAVPLSGFVGLEWPELNFGNIFSKIAAAADTVASGNCASSSSCDSTYTNWKLDSEGVLTISGSGAMENYVYTNEVPWASYRESIKKVVIENGVTNIGSVAFWNCDSLTSITIPDSVTSIGRNAFEDCDSLVTITIPDSVTIIDTSVFLDCDSLASINIPDSVTVISNYAFWNCDSLASITFPDSVTKIGPAAFYSCDSLVNITIPDSVIYIGNSAFYYCDSLESITILNPDCTVGGYDYLYSDSGYDPAIDSGATIYGFSNSTAQSYAEQYGRRFIPIVHSGTCGENLNWMLDNDGTLTISGTGAMTNYYLNASKAPWRSYRSSVKKVVIGSGVTSIGSYAFESCDTLASISIPDSVTSIGSSAFDFCDSLASVEFGENSQLTSIGRSAFYACTSLANITIPDSVTSIGGSAFSGCTAMTDISMGDNVQTLGDYAFYNCKKLTAVTVPDTVTSIGNIAFYGCDSLASVEFCENSQLTSIGSYAFAFCDSLASVEFGENSQLTSIDKGAFESCTSLASITIPDSVTSIGSYAFAFCDRLASVDFGDNSQLKSIGSDAFYGCDSLASVDFGDNSQLTSIGSDAFYGCDSLASITIPASVTSIDYAAFYSCDSLASVDFGDNSQLTSIGIWAFYNCTSLTSISIPASVTSIGSSAFYDCDSLASVDFGDNSQLTSIGSSAFYDCDRLASITIPASVTSIDSNAFSSCDSLASITVDPNNKYYSSDECGVLFNQNKTTLIQYPIGNTTRTSYTIPASVTIIGNSAFRDCDSLASITIPASVTSIGNVAFYSCDSLASITIPASLTSIGYSAFKDCDSLASVDFGDNSQLTSIGEHAFATCISLASINIPDSVTSIGDEAFCDCDSLASVDFGENSQLTSIGERAFATCISLASITIPASVTSIGGYAFNVCTSLDEIHIEDVAAWCNISYGNMYSNPNYYAEKLYLNGELLTDLVVPEGVTAIKDYVFYNCKKLNSVSIPSTVTSIGNYAFSGCSGLAEISMNEGVQTIGNYAFYNCKKLTAVTVPDSVTAIGDYAFYACSGLEYVMLSENLNSVGSSAFYACSKLGNAYFFGNAPASFGSNVFKNTKSDFGIYVFDLAEETGWTQPTWNGYNVYLSNSADLVTKTLDADNKDSAGVKYIVNPATMTAKVSGYEGTATEVTVPCAVKKDGVKYTVTAVDYEAFRNKGLTQILLPNTIESIGAYAFAENPGLTEFDIRNKTVSLGANAFMGCTGLERVYLNHVLPAIGKTTFKNCSSLKGIVLGSNVTTIAEQAFYGCKQLSSVNLENITEIGEKAFYNCDKLQQLTLSRNIASIGNEAFADCKQLVGAHFTGNHPQTVGSDIFGDTANDKFYVIYPPAHETWQGKVTDARWHDYQAVPFNAVTQLALEEGEIHFYFFRIYDVFGEPLEGATVTLNGQSAETYADGYAYLPTPEKLTVPLKITKLGYNPIEKDHTIEAVPLAFYTLTEDPSTVTPLSCNGKNINTGVAQINVAANETAEIVVSGYSQFPIESYNIMQNGNVIKTSTSSTIRVENKLFIPGADVYVAMHTADGKTVTEKLNILVVNVTADGLLSIPDDNALVIETPSDLPLLGKTVLAIKIGDITSEMSAKVTNDEITVAYGISLEQALGSKPYDLKNLFRVKGKFGADVNFEIKGHIKADIVGDDVVIKEYKLGIGGFIQLDVGTTVVAVFIPLRVEGTFTGGSTMELTLAVDEEQGIYLEELTMVLELGLKLRVGVGCKWVSAGIYGSGKLAFNFYIVPIQKLVSVDYEIEAGLYVKYSGIFVKWTKEWALWKYPDKSRSVSNGRVGASAGDPHLLYSMPDITDPANYDYVTREYLNTRSGWYPSGPPRVGASAQATDDVTASAQLLQSSAYTDLAPQLITCGDTTMMVYLDDDASLDDYNYQKLVYSIYSEEGKIWSEPQSVVDDGLFETSPAVSSDGERYIYITFSRANRAITSEDIGDESDEGIAQTMEVYSSVSETAVVVYDTQTGEFSELTVLTNNDVLDTSQIVHIINGIPSVLWIENTANDPFLVNGENNLYKSQFIDGKWETSLVITDCGLVTNLDAGMLNGKAYIALCVDEDNELLTEGDSNIYLVDENSGIFCLTEQAGAYFMPTFATFDGVAQLVWYQDGNLCFITAPDGEISTILETPSDKLSPHFKLIENNGRYDILFSANNDSETDEEGNLLDPGSDIYGIFYDNGWGNPIKITDAGNSYYINAFDAYYKDDELLIPYLRTLVTFYEDGSGYSEECDFYSTLVEFNGNITVSDPVFADSDLFDDDKLTVSLTINNSMNRKINGLRFTVTAPDGSEVDTLTTDSVILSGANEDVEFTFTLPDEITEGAYTITAVPLNGSDADESDNSVSMCLLYPDLVVNAKQTIIGTKTYIHVSVENTGNASSDGTLNIRINHRDEVIHSLPFDSIAPGEKKLFEITTDASFFDGDAKTGLVCVAAENENDVNTNNNKAYISLFDPSEDEIDTDSVAKQSSVYPLHFSYDKNGGEVTTVELNANTNSFEGIENVDNAAYTLADNKLTFNTAYLNSLAEGEQTFLFTFRDKNNDLQKISVAVYISDTTPEEITGEISIDGNAKVNGILSVNTANLSENTAVFTCQWYSDGSAIQGATQSTYAVRSADVGKSISVTITASGNYAGTFTSPSIAITCEHVFKNWITLTPATCTTDGTQKGSCACGATSQRDVTAPGHAWSTTCTSNGDGENNTHYQTCTRTGCDATSDAVAHTWNEGVVAPDPTCEDAGIRTFTCTASGCGATFTEAVDANGHSYGEWIAEIPATCIATGTRGHYDCADCDKHFDADKAEIADLTIAINSANHVHTTEHEQQAATCTDIGYTAGTFCEDCDKWISGHEEIPAIAHKNKVHHERVESTCSATGTIEYWSCPDCSKNFSDEACTTEATDLTVAINPEAHKWDEGKVTTEPGCHQMGIKTYTCEYDANHTKPEEIGYDLNNHINTENHDAVKETCTSVGYTAGVYCTDCKAYISGHEEIPAIAHKNKVHHEKVDATCVATGIIEYWSCPDCSKNFSDEACNTVVTDLTIAIDPNNHDLKTTEAKAPTCTEIGWDAYVTCQREGCGYTTYKAIEANGHDYDLTTGTNNNNGTHTVTCKNCGENTEGHTDVVDCTYGEGVVTDPTCTKGGYTTHTCTVCGYSYTDIETTATGHKFGAWTANNDGTHTRTCTACTDEEGRTETADCTYGEWTETKAPTCTEKGEKAHTCSVCNNTVTEEVEALGHEYGEADCTKPATCTRCDATTGEALGHDFTVFVKTVDYTCTEKGYDIYKCSRCDATENKNYTDAACRPEADYTVTKQATCEADGEESIFCSACDKALVTTVIEKRAHVYKDNGVKTSATCVAEGVMNTICTNEETAEYAACAHESTRVIPVDKDAHKWETEYTVDKKASCDEAGSKSYHCEYCDAINADSVVDIAKREHNLVDTTVALAPTCSATGIMNQKCDCEETAEYEACSYTTTRVMDKVADAHKWETEYTVDKKASCDAAGSKSYHCEYCDAINADSVVEIAKREHNLVDTTVALAPTCSATGIMNQKCACAETAEYEACDYTTTRVMDKVADAHKAEAEYIQTIAPTCSAVGEEKLYCEYCDAVLDTREVAIDADAHKWETEYTVDVKASCDAAGTKSYHCEYCDAINADSVVEIAKREHNLVDTTVALAPTCSATGIMNQKCDHVGSDEYEACDYTTTRVMDKVADAHKAEAEYIQTVAPTCSAVGEEKLYCEYCDAVLDTREVEIDADAHKWETEYTVDKKASCDAAGSKSYHCALCDAKNADSVVEIAKREHNLVDTTVALAPTCSATGTMNQKCDHVGSDEYEACDYTTTREIPALGHKWGEWTVTIPATYLQEGEEIRTCNECGTTETHTLDKLPLPDSIVIAEPYTTVKVSDGFVVTSVNKTVADLLAVSNATNVLTATGENADAATVLATGMQLVITDGETVVGCMEIVILGDVDGDGIITAGDARMALRASVGLDVLNAARQKAADTDTSNTIAASDAREILRAAVGLDDPVVWFEKI